jgi:hypothetical protein
MRSSEPPARLSLSAGRARAGLAQAQFIGITEPCSPESAHSPQNELAYRSPALRVAPRGERDESHIASRALRDRSGTTLQKKAGIMVRPSRDVFVFKGQPCARRLPRSTHKGRRRPTPGASFSHASNTILLLEAMIGCKATRRQLAALRFPSLSADRWTAIRSPLRFQLATRQQSSLLPLCHNITVIRLSLRLPGLGGPEHVTPASRAI